MRLSPSRSIAALLVTLAVAVPAAATTLGAAVNVDNEFKLYLSTDDSVLGTEVLSGVNWPTTYVLAAAALGSGTQYLHLVATDLGPPGAFLGEFSLSDSGFKFANGTQHLLTNTSDWNVRIAGFGDADQAPVSLGLNGVGPWGTRSGVSASAEWIWSADGCGSCTRYFSTEIASAVPEPQTYALMLSGLALVGAALRRRRSH